MTNKKTPLWLVAIRDYLFFIALSFLLTAAFQYFGDRGPSFAVPTNIFGSGVLVGFYATRFTERYGFLKGCLLPILLFILFVVSMVFLFGQTLFYLPWIWVLPLALLLFGVALVFHLHFLRKSYKIDWGNKPGRHEK